MTIRLIRPFLGPKGCCKFVPSCTQFAEIQFATRPFFSALCAIIKRLLVCNSLIPHALLKRWLE